MVTSLVTDWIRGRNKVGPVLPKPGGIEWRIERHREGEGLIVCLLGLSFYIKGNSGLELGQG